MLFAGLCGPHFRTIDRAEICTHFPFRLWKFRENKIVKEAPVACDQLKFSSTFPTFSCDRSGAHTFLVSQRSEFWKNGHLWSLGLSCQLRFHPPLSENWSLRYFSMIELKFGTPILRDHLSNKFLRGAPSGGHSASKTVQQQKRNLMWTTDMWVLRSLWFDYWRRLAHRMGV